MLIVAYARTAFDQTVSAAMIADGMTGHPCPAALNHTRFGWIECSLTVGHVGPCHLS